MLTLTMAIVTFVVVLFCFLPLVKSIDRLSSWVKSARWRCCEKVTNRWKWMFFPSWRTCWSTTTSELEWVSECAHLRACAVLEWSKGWPVRARASNLFERSSVLSAFSTRCQLQFEHTNANTRAREERQTKLCAFDCRRDNLVSIEFCATRTHKTRQKFKWLWTIKWQQSKSINQSNKFSVVAFTSPPKSHKQKRFCKDVA